MTEEEAKTKWCPFANVVAVGLKAGQHAMIGNREAQISGRTIVGRNHEHALCLGSDCMAWRWTVDNSDLAPGFVKTLNRDGSTTLVRAQTAKHYNWKTVAPDGFCGLAGRPS